MKMRISKIFALVFASCISAFGQSNEWNGLIPLLSTRVDVEKRLGAPKENFYGAFRYEYEGSRVEIYYSGKRCGAGWDITKDTVLSIWTSSASLIGKSFDELKLDKSRFDLTVDDAFYGTWTNPVDGLRYYFYLVDEKLKSVEYLPKKSDNGLRCDGFPPFAPEGFYRPYKSRKFYDPELKKSEGLIKNFIDGVHFLVSLGNHGGKSEYRGYIMVYFDDKLTVKDYQKRLDELKKHLFNYRKADPEQVTVIEGGMRTESVIEFYILPAKSKPPSPDPTLPSPQFMRKK